MNRLLTNFAGIYVAKHACIYTVQLLLTQTCMLAFTAVGSKLVVPNNTRKIMANILFLLSLVFRTVAICCYNSVYLHEIHLFCMHGCEVAQV